MIQFIVLYVGAFIAGRVSYDVLKITWKCFKHKRLVEYATQDMCDNLLIHRGNVVRGDAHIGYTPITEVIVPRRVRLTMTGNFNFERETLMLFFGDMHVGGVVGEKLTPKRRNILKMEKENDVDGLLNMLEKEKDKRIVKDIQQWLLRNVKEGVV